MYNPSTNRCIPKEFYVIGSAYDPICNYILETTEKKFGEYVRFYDAGSSYSIETTRTSEQNTYRQDSNKILDNILTPRTTPIYNQYQNQVQFQLQGQGQIQVQTQVQVQSGNTSAQNQAQTQDSGQTQIQSQMAQTTPQPQDIIPLSQKIGFPRVFFKDDAGLMWFFPITGQDNRWWDILNMLIKTGRGPLFFLQNNIRNALLPTTFPNTPPVSPYPAKL